MFFILAFLLLWANPTYAADSEVYIKITQANFKKSLMALPPFQFVGTPNSSRDGFKVGKELFDVFRNDMEVSGYFEFVRSDAFLEDTAKVGLKPSSEEPGGFSFNAWKQVGADFLVRVGYRVLGDDITVDTYTYSVGREKLAAGKTYRSKVKDLRTLAHTFANDVIFTLTGEKGMFLSKIVTSRSTRPQQKEIFILDWDGTNATQVTHHKSIALSPTWAPDGKSIAYSSFAYHVNRKSRNLDLFTYELQTGRRYLVSYRQGLNSGANYCPDNKHILLTISNQGNPDIYKMTLDGLKLTRLTHASNGVMNVEPAMSPDGKKVAFSSTRSGQPMIYIMDSDGTNVKRVTFAGEYNSTPAWSPDGKKIAFAARDKSHYDVFIMDADGTNMARLTSAKKVSGSMADNEDPSFSPDGKQILFRSNRTGTYQLYIVSTDGETERRITFDQYNYYKPRWSPFIE